MKKIASLNGLSLLACQQEEIHIKILPSSILTVGLRMKERRNKQEQTEERKVE